MTSPWERLREAVSRVAQMPKDHRSIHSGEMLLKWDAMIEALAALPAAPPEQSASAAERERAIEALNRRMTNLAVAEAPADIVVALGEIWMEALALMRSAPAPQPGTITCKCGAVATLLPIDCKSSVGRIGCAKCGHELMRWGPQPVPAPPASDPYGEGVGYKAPPASDWRERFDNYEREVGVIAQDSLILRDGLAALEAEVARLSKKVDLP